MLQSRFWALTGMILIAALSRVVPHPPNVTPIAALALFGGAYYSCKRFAFAIPFLAMFLSDCIIGFHRQIGTVYLCFSLTVLMGFFLRSRKNVSYVAIAGLASSALFYLVTNFGVWLWDGLYPATFKGLWACYIAALPFFRNELLGNFFYITALFGSFAWAQKGIPSLREQELSSGAIHS